MARPLLCSIIFAIVLASTARSQTPTPLPASTDVSLGLRTRNDVHEFHVGELIPITVSYRSTSPGRYSWLIDDSFLDGGRPLEVTCSAPAQHIDSSHAPVKDEFSFERMLHEPCGPVAFGGRSHNSCAGCEEGRPLTTSALSLDVLPLNSSVRFPSTGTYTCQASAANITSTPVGAEYRPALLLKSNPLVLNLTSDPSWAHEVVVAYGAAFDKFCRNDSAPQRNFLQCSELAQRITYLGTKESLALEVKFFDGRNHGWDDGFWTAIKHAPSSESLDLMKSRLQDPDFQASPEVIKWLAATDLKVTSAQAFTDEEPATYHDQAVETLRKYVRLLGNSLSLKRELAVKTMSSVTYFQLASSKYCSVDTLIPDEEQLPISASLQ